MKHIVGRRRDKLKNAAKGFRPGATGKNHTTKFDGRGRKNKESK